jgi:DNA-binding NarL/FixJ family response regulator
LARVRNEEVAAKARLAATAFDAISFPYYATYYRWREAEAMLRERNLAATDLLRHLRSTARSYGFFGLDEAITALARANQLRLGPGRTTVDGAEPLSERELEVLRLLAEGHTNPEIAERLFITRRTAGAHVSNILRKVGASSRAEAVSEAHRRQLL